MQTCPNCGNQIAQGKKFCANCGTPMTQQQSPPPQQYQQQPQQPPSSSPPNYQFTAQTTQPPPQQQQYQQPPQQYQQTPQQPDAGFAQGTSDSTWDMDPMDIERNKTTAGLAYFLFFLPLAACPNSRYGRFHANQGLIVLIVSIVFWIIVFTLSHVLDWQLRWITTILSVITWLSVLALVIVGLINGFTGKAKDLPVIGAIRLIK